MGLSGNICLFHNPKNGWILDFSSDEISRLREALKEEINDYERPEIQISQLVIEPLVLIPKELVKENKKHTENLVLSKDVAAEIIRKLARSNRNVVLGEIQDKKFPVVSLRLCKLKTV